MVNNYLITAIRNIRKHKVFSCINITGLAVGMSVCMLILLWVQDELSFDSFHEHTDDIYRVISEIHTADHMSHNARTPNPLGPILKEDFPEIVNFARFQGFDGWLVQSGDKSFINDNLGTADPSFFEIFSFPFLQGDPKTALQDRYSIVITEGMAKKYFGDEDPMGKVLTIHHDYTVTGIIENVPENSHLHFDCIFPLKNMEYFWDENFDDWERIKYYTYVQVQPKSSHKIVSQKISNVIRENFPQSNTTVYLQPLKDIHLRSDFEWDLDNYAQGNITYLYIFALTALCILLIACINFMNLSTARSAKRAQEVGIRKVSGARRLDIVRQFFGESILLTFTSLLCAVGLTYLLLPLFNDLSSKQLSLRCVVNAGFLMGLAAITVATGVVSGSYPALYLSKFHPARVFRGISRWGTHTGTSLRKTLVIFQFALTIILIIGTTVIQNQLHYLKNKNLGFTKDHIITFESRHMNYEGFRNELLQHPNILSMTQSHAPNRQPWGVTGFYWEGKDYDEDIMLYPVNVDYDYVHTFDMRMLEGRFFSREYSTDATQAAIVNETAVKVMNMAAPVGKRISRGEHQATIIGVIKDFHQSSLHNEIEPLILRISQGGPYICARIHPRNVSKTIASIETIWRKYVKDYPFTYEFLDTSIERYYKSEQKMCDIFAYSTLLAIFIACLGLFGLASFVTEQRTKEIGIRKILGASFSGIVFLLTREFIKWVLMANAIAWPIAYLAMTRWLQGFAFRINLGIWIFIFSSAMTILIAFSTVSYQSLKAALMNPVKSLRYE
ncbi:MAG: ABC transporter permease [Gemmatimonadota bacterium]|nr:MAG: ABC transporter permease [Gemmatimonadota bacterium]